MTDDKNKRFTAWSLYSFRDLKHLLKKDGEVKIRFSHVAQMNDPLEGKVLMSFFGDKYYNSVIHDVSFNKYILCLTSNLE